MPSPTKWDTHAVPNSHFGWFCNHYSVFTDGVSVGEGGTIRLDLDNEPQPGVAMIVRPEFGGRVTIDEDGYVSGSPELIAEVSASSVSIDLGKKLRVYRRNGVAEYLVWRVSDEAIDWFVL